MPRSVSTKTRASAAFDVRTARAAVHGLDQIMEGRPLVYLDSAATSQRATAAVDAMGEMLRRTNANIHQEGFALARQAKEEYDGARETVAKFLGADDPSEVIWVHGATEGINLVMATWGEDTVGRDDNVVVTEQEHLSNLLPWQLLSRRTGCDLRVIETERDGSLRLDNLDRIITRRTRLVGMSHASNVTGAINPVAEIGERARAVGARFLIDGAQSAPHIDIDVQELGCDFFVCSGHKMLAPFGTGVVWGRREILAEMTPYNVGGGSAKAATFKRATFEGPPKRFEGGTDNPSGALAMAAAINTLRTLGPAKAWQYEQRLVGHALERLLPIPGLAIIGSTEPDNRLPIFTFVLEGHSGKDLARKLGERGIAVSGGDLNAGPFLERLQLEEVTRASAYVYTTAEEIDVLTEALAEIANG
jgi:cysteine desulfurase / selenocysteine lyase